MAISVSCECGMSYRVKDGLAGKRARCKSCGRTIMIAPAGELPHESAAKTPSDQDDIDSSIQANVCFYCKKRPAGSDDTQALKRVLVGPFRFACIECSHEWDEPARTIKPRETSFRRDDGSYVPTCPSCGGRNNASVGLPSVPTGQFYKDFKNSGVRQNADGDLNVTLTGIVSIPRCSHCARHLAIIMAMPLAIGIVAFLLLAYKMVSGALDSRVADDADLLFFTLLAAVLWAFLLALVIFVIGVILSTFVFVLITLVLGIFSGASLNSPEDFPPLKRLRDDGWKNSAT